MLILFLLFAMPGTSNTNLADAAFISKIDIIFFGANYCLWCDRRPKRLFKNVAISKLHFHQLHQTLPRARNIHSNCVFQIQAGAPIQRRPQDSGISTIFLIPSRWFTKGKAGSLYNRCFGAGRILNRRTRSQESLEVNAL